MKISINSFWGWKTDYVLKLRQAWSVYAQSGQGRWYFILAGLFNLSSWVGAWLIWRRLPGKFVILHYNIIFGTDKISVPASVFLLPLLGLGALLLNWLLNILVFNKEELSKHLLLGGAVAVNLFLFLALCSVYMINYI